MGLDIRIPIGALFTLLGAYLALYGLLGDKTIYAQSMNININLAWGLVLVLFGVLMLLFGMRKPTRR